MNPSPTSQTPATFDPAAPLPMGTLLLEASAGTGKTWSITALALRLIAELGLDIRQILVVTFTRAATAELRDRLRKRLIEAAAALAGTPTEPFLAEWAPKAPPEAPARIAAALRDFDLAPISTIHSFCQKTLREQAFEAGAELGLELLDDEGPLLQEAVDDALSRDLHDLPLGLWRLLVEELSWDRATLTDLGRLALADPTAPVLPEPADLPSLIAAWQAQKPEILLHLVQTLAPALRTAFAETQRRKALKPKQRTWSTTRLEEAIQAAIEGLTAAEHPSPSLCQDLLSHNPLVMAKQLDPEVPLPDWPDLDTLANFVQPTAFAGPLRARFVHQLRLELSAKKARLGVCSFQDLLELMRARIDHPIQGPILIRALRQRYQAALIDEFQDTDAVQWKIFSKVFQATPGSPPDRHLFLIGDPKQAIYAFRGADILVYLDASATADARQTMGRNHRSDQPLVEAVGHILGIDADNIFAEPRIPFVEVDTPARTPPARLCDASGQALTPVHLRYHLPERDENGGAKELTMDEARQLTLEALRSDIVALLSSGAHILGNGDRSAPRDLGPGDLAVLVRTNREAAQVRDLLLEAAVPAVIAASGNVFETPEAGTLHDFLATLAEPHREGPARAFALSPGTGWDPAGILQRTADWANFQADLRKFRNHFDRSGFMSAFRLAFDQLGILERLLQTPAGARPVTNLLHLAELLHKVATEGRLSIDGLQAALARLRAEPPPDAEAAELRLESDAAAVKVVTVHKSKGLEYPIVFLPFLWGAPQESKKPWCLARDPGDTKGVKRRLDLREGHPELDASLAQAAREQAQEGLRLLYVALTRARHQLHIYTGAFPSLPRSPLGAVLHGADPTHPIEPDRIAAARLRIENLAENTLLGDLRALAARAPAHIVVSTYPADLPFLAWNAPRPRALQLSLRPGPRQRFDERWQRYSYSSLTRAGHAPVAPVREEEAAGADPNRAGFDADGSVQEVPLALPEAPPFPLPLAEAPASAEAGTFLHAVFEHLDFAQAKLGPEALRPVVDTQLRLHAQDPARWGPELPAALAAVLTTPLELSTRSSLFDPHPTPGFCLADIPRKARLDELRFDLPIAGGSTFGRDPLVQPVTGESLRKVLELRRGALPGPWLDSLAGLPIGELAGFLTGSIDLVFRHNGRWYVVDYKSNRLAPRGQTLDAAHYRPEALSAAMSEHHYFLQYHLYSLALFRFLSARLRGAWDPERDWGGVYYLFIRGMAGPETPTYASRPAGVFFDRPPVAAIAALDHLFRTGETTACL